VKVEPQVALALTSEHPGFDKLVAELENEHAEVDGADIDDLETSLAEEVASKLPALAAAFVAASLRAEIVTALEIGFGDQMRLLASLWGACHRSGDEEPDEAEQVDQSVLNDPCYFDEQTGERMNAFEWVRGSCPVCAIGYPEFNPRHIRARRPPAASGEQQ
jgi:hypothetical protein